MEKQPRNRHWGSRIDLAGSLTVLGIVSTILWTGFNFIRDTQASNHKVYEQEASIALVTSRIDRMDGNIEIMMNDRDLKPLKKTPTERILERTAKKTFVDATQATDDSDLQ